MANFKLVAKANSTAFLPGPFLAVVVFRARIFYLSFCVPGGCVCVNTPIFLFIFYVHDAEVCVCGIFRGFSFGTHWDFLFFFYVFDYVYFQLDFLCSPLIHSLSASGPVLVCFCIIDPSARIFVNGPS